MPYFGSGYNALTDHRFWDGGRHYWTGMTVKGMEDQDPDNPMCCPDLAVYEGGDVAPDPRALAGLRAALGRTGLTHREAADRLDMGLSRMRQRLYGQRPFSRAQFSRLCRMAGVDAEGLFDPPGTAGEVRP